MKGTHCLQAVHSAEDLIAPDAGITPEDEARPVDVTWRIYWKYFQAAGGFWALLVIFVTNVSLRVSYLCFDYYTAFALTDMGMHMPKHFASFPVSKGKGS